LLDLIATGRIDPSPLLTHTMKLGSTVDAYAVFAGRKDGCVKIALEP
jgi:threonine dehydrogenase-like Zn-dependent dehydrogenase